MGRPGGGPPGGFGKGQAPRPNAAQAKAENERYDVFQARVRRIADAAARAGHGELAETLADLGQRVQDREITLEEGLAELRSREASVRSALKR